MKRTMAVSIAISAVACPAFSDPSPTMLWGLQQFVTADNGVRQAAYLFLTHVSAEGTVTLLSRWGDTSVKAEETTRDNGMYLYYWAVDEWRDTRITASKAANWCCVKYIEHRLKAAAHFSVALAYAEAYDHERGWQWYRLYRQHETHAAGWAKRAGVKVSNPWDTKIHIELLKSLR